jgi:hypothetical protein
VAFGPDLWGFVKKIDGLMAVEAKHDGAIGRLQTQLDDLKGRVTRLECGEEVVAATRDKKRLK